MCNHPTRNIPLNGDRFLQLVQKVKSWFLKMPPLYNPTRDLTKNIQSLFFGDLVIFSPKSNYSIEYSLLLLICTFFQKIAPKKKGCLNFIITTTCTITIF